MGMGPWLRAIAVVFQANTKWDIYSMEDSFFIAKNASAPSPGRLYQDVNHQNGSLLVSR